MTEHEMRISLAEAMGWTDIQTSKTSGQVTGIDADGNAGTIPNPLESDRDAARLRAWCVGRGLRVATYAETSGRYSATRAPYAWSGARVSSPDRPINRMDQASQYVVGECWLRAAEEPDPCRRERTVLCRAVVQALDTVDAGGGA